MPFLLGRGARLDAVDDQGNTVLHQICSKTRWPTGSDPVASMDWIEPARWLEVRNKDGDTPLDCAVAYADEPSRNIASAGMRLTIIEKLIELSGTVSLPVLLKATATGPHQLSDHLIDLLIKWEPLNVTLESEDKVSCLHTALQEMDRLVDAPPKLCRSAGKARRVAHERKRLRPSLSRGANPESDAPPQNLPFR